MRGLRLVNLPTWLQVTIIASIFGFFLIERSVSRRRSSSGLSTDPSFANAWRIQYPSFSIRDVLIWSWH